MILVFKFRVGLIFHGQSGNTWQSVNASEMCPLYLPPCAPLSSISCMAVTEEGQTFKVSAQAGSLPMILETGRLAQLASGAVEASIGDTKVLVTAVSANTRSPTADFLPLLVSLAYPYPSW